MRHGKQDLGSTNGIKLNGKPLETGADVEGTGAGHGANRCSLHVNDQVKVGTTTLIVKAGSVAASHDALNRSFLDSAHHASESDAVDAAPDEALQGCFVQHTHSLCWHARTSVMLVVMTVVERVEAGEVDSPIVELDAIFKSLLDSIRRWVELRGESFLSERVSLLLTCFGDAATIDCRSGVCRIGSPLSDHAQTGNAPDSEVLAFGIQAVTCLVPAFRHRADDLQDGISFGVKRLLELLPDMAQASDSNQVLFFHHSH